MMHWIVSTSLRYRLIVVAVVGIIFYFGVQQLRDLRVDLLPEFSRPYVEVQTEALGLSAAEVESLITTPLEADMLSGMPWADEIRSESMPGLSSIVIYFKRGTDVLAARQMVQERLVSVHALPQVSKPPAMVNPVSSTNRVMMVGLSSDKMSPIEMSVQARWIIKPRLMGVAGVANVSIFGQRQRQLQVQVDPARLKESNITLNQVISTTGNALWVSPLSFLNASTPGTGGWIETPNQRLGVRHLLPISTPEELAQVTVEGTDMALGDVANVVETHQPLIGDGIVNNESNLILVVEKLPEANTVEVTRGVEDALASLSHGLSDLDMDTTLFRPATFVEILIANISKSLFVGGALVVLALFVFMFNWRTALIATVAIVSSFLCIIIVLQIFEVPLNMLVVAGITIALLAIIDDAIIEVDHIARRLRNLADWESTGPTVVAACLELRRPLGYALAILAVAAVPIFVIQGVYGALLQAVAWAYLLALVVSTIVALVVTTVLSFLVLRGEGAGRTESPVHRALQWLFDVVCAPLIRAPGPVFAVVCVALVLAAFLCQRLRRDALLPVVKELDVAVQLDANPGTSRMAMTRIVSRASSDLGKIPGVRKVCAHVGRAVMSDEVANTNSTELWVSIDPTADYDATMAAIHGVVDSFTGLERDVTTHTRERLDDAISNEPQVATVRIYGDDYRVMNQKAAQVAAVLENVDGLGMPDIDEPLQEPSLEIEPDLERVKKYGLKPGDVRRAAATLLSGILVGNLFEEQKVFDVVVWGVPEIRHSLTGIQDLMLDTPGGEQVALGEVADVRIVPTETVIERDTVARHVDVTAAVYGGDYAAIAAQIKLGIGKIDFPLEYRAELLPGYGDRLASIQQIITFTVAAAIAIYLLLQATFGSWRLATAVFLTVPAAFLGGVVAVYWTGSLVSLGSLAGFVALLVIAVRNGTLTVRRYQALDEPDADRTESVVRSTRERAGTMVISALVSALAFAPLVWFGADTPGLEILHPMAIVVLGGLVTSTLYSLIGIPAVYLLFGASAASVRAPGTGDFASFGGSAGQPAT